MFNCQAVNQLGANDVYGFIANGGQYNMFQGCQATDIQSTTTHTANGIYLGDSEFYDKIIKCKIYDIQSTGTAYGIFGSLFAAADINIANGGITINSIDWSPDGKYFALGDANGNLKVYSFNGRALTFITSITRSAILKIAWSPTDTAPYYIALIDQSNNFAKYSFIGTTLTQVAQVYVFGVTTLGWATDGQHLAANPSASTLQAYDTSLNSIGSAVTAGGTINAIDWSSTPTYRLALGTASTIETYNFNGTGFTLAHSAAVGSIPSVDWSPHGDYLAAAENQSGNNIVAIFAPDLGGGSPIASTFIALTTPPAQVAWAADNITLAAVTASGTAGIYSFNGTTLTLEQTKSHGAQLNTLAWPQSGSYTGYLAVAGFTSGGYEGIIYTLGSSLPTQHTIANNLVNQVITAAMHGVGIVADSSVNYVAQNTSCNNDLNFQGVEPAYLDSQANARGVDNVDCSLTTADEVSQILKEAWSIESKTEVISSKIDTFTPCQATPLFQPADSRIDLLTTDNYCFATDIAATVSIQAQNVNLCLNNRTLYGQLIIDAAAATISNGALYAPQPTDSADADSPALAITTQATGAQINNLTITCQNSADSLAGRVGMKVWGSNAYIKECSVQSGSAGAGQPGGNAIEIAPACQSARIRETDIVGTGSGRGAAAGNGINLDRGCANVEIRNCTFMSTGTGNSATGGLAIYDDSAASSRTDLYTSVIYDNFAYSTGNVPPVENFAQFPLETPKTLDSSLSPAVADTSTILRGALNYGIHTPITISRSGVYRLDGPLNASAESTALTISANNVTLDLAGNTISGGATGIAVTGNNIAIKNGTIQNMSTAGIHISGTKCQSEALDVINSGTGFLIQNTNSTSITNCRALGSTSAGFSLIASYTTSITNCQALNTNGTTQSAYGFVSQNGYGNIFEQCTAQNTQTNSTISNSLAAGFLLAHESASTIASSQAYDTLSLTTTAAAYGIATNLPTDATLNLLNSQALGAGVLSAAWSPDGRFLAIVIINQIRIYQWEPSSASLQEIVPARTAYTGTVIPFATIAWSPD